MTKKDWFVQFGQSGVWMMLGTSGLNSKTEFYFWGFFWSNFSGKNTDLEKWIGSNFIIAQCQAAYTVEKHLVSLEIHDPIFISLFFLAILLRKKCMKGTLNILPQSGLSEMEKALQDFCL